MATNKTLIIVGLLALALLIWAVTTGKLGGGTTFFAGQTTEELYAVGGDCTTVTHCQTYVATLGAPDDLNLKCINSTCFVQSHLDLEVPQ